VGIVVVDGGGTGTLNSFNVLVSGGAGLFSVLDGTSQLNVLNVVITVCK
jgi:hypothetical protein